MVLNTDIALTLTLKEKAINFIMWTHFLWMDFWEFLAEYLLSLGPFTVSVFLLICLLSCMRLFHSKYQWKRPHPQFPLDTSPLRCVSTMPAEQIRFTLVSVSIPTRSAALRICSVPAPAVRSPPAQIHRTSISGRCRSTTQQFSWI